MPKQITAWQCDHCRKYLKTKRGILAHQRICFGNPKREIQDGELAIWETMPVALKAEDNYGVPNSSWREPVQQPSAELIAEYLWWPLDDDGEFAIGLINHGGVWHHIVGYEPPHFAPGRSWRDEVLPIPFEIGEVFNARIADVEAREQGGTAS